MSKPRIAVILFPGINMEEEMVSVCLASGMSAEIVRWNNHSKLDSYDGYIIGGGFSYQDRVRAGVIAAQDPLMDILKQESKKGKPILGICNGCQILVESGLIPGLKDEVEFALAPNINPEVSGYYNVWINIKNVGNKNSFNNLIEQDEVIPMPIAHGEGRFVTTNKSLVKDLEKNRQIIFQYSTSSGKVSEEFPTNPNSSTFNIAGISNKKGNVLAMMPHPERSAWIKQLPDLKEKIDAKGNLEALESAGPGRKIFLSMKNYIENGKKL
tara:strand:- start:3475 stop:4281 length:807 start_codon:yes stop_codon:yes gene_type:complete